MNREILRIAIPSIIANITVPLLGIVDLAIVGHLNNEAAIGAIAVGGLIFNMVYWLFNFLRMGSSGLTAQAYGRRDLISVKKVLRMGLGVSLLCGIGIFAIKEMGRFYRHVLVQKRYPHHGAVAFAHCGKLLFEVFKYLGVKDIAWNQPKNLPYPTENPWA